MDGTINEKRWWALVALIKYLTHTTFFPNNEKDIRKAIHSLEEADFPWEDIPESSYETSVGVSLKKRNDIFSFAVKDRLQSIEMYDFSFHYKALRPLVSGKLYGLYSPILNAILPLLGEIIDLSFLKDPESYLDTKDFKLKSYQDIIAEEDDSIILDFNLLKPDHAIQEVYRNACMTENSFTYSIYQDRDSIGISTEKKSLVEKQIGNSPLQVFVPHVQKILCIVDVSFIISDEAWHQIIQMFLQKNPLDFIIDELLNDTN